MWLMSCRLLDNLRLLAHVTPSWQVKPVSYIKGEVKLQHGVKLKHVSAANRKVPPPLRDGASQHTLIGAPE